MTQRQEEGCRKGEIILCPKLRKIHHSRKVCLLPFNSKIRKLTVNSFQSWGQCRIQTCLFIHSTNANGSVNVWFTFGKDVDYYPGSQTNLIASIWTLIFFLFISYMLSHNFIKLFTTLSYTLFNIRSHFLRNGNPEATKIT